MTKKQRRQFLVIGGAGYIGSHFVKIATQLGHSCVVYDNLSRGHAYAIPSSALFVKADILNPQDLKRVLQHHSFDAIFHFAAYALVGESKENPDIYYRNNVVGVQTLLEVLAKDGRQIPLIFSSTCAVFGIPSLLPIVESAPKNPVSPYGRSKLMAEWLIEDFCAAFGLRGIILRYFNACGAFPNGELGEDHEPETHLIPNAIKAALEGKPLSLYGTDYPTEDGTCVRDYIHVLDLAEAHLQAASLAENLGAHQIQDFNLGTSTPISNLEIVRTVEAISGRKIYLNYFPRRPGDPPCLYADGGKARKILGFSPRQSIEDSIRSALLWHSRKSNIF